MYEDKYTQNLKEVFILSILDHYDVKNSWVSLQNSDSLQQSLFSETFPITRMGNQGSIMGHHKTSGKSSLSSLDLLTIIVTIITTTTVITNIMNIRSGPSPPPASSHTTKGGPTKETQWLCYRQVGRWEWTNQGMSDDHHDGKTLCTNWILNRRIFATILQSRGPLRIPKICNKTFWIGNAAVPVPSPHPALKKIKFDVWSLPIVRWSFLGL